MNGCWACRRSPSPRRRSPTGDLRRGLPPGALAVGGGLVAASATTYGFLALAARVLGPEGYAPVAVLWSALFLVVPTVWTPVEQEVARQISARAARHEGGRPVVVAGARLAARLGLPVLVGLGIVGVVGAESLFSGRVGVGLALVLAVVAFAPNHLTRAALAGTGSFGRYGLCIALDSATRLALGLGLAAAGVDHPVPWALAVAVAPLVPVAAFRHRWGLAARPGPPARPVHPEVLPLVGAQGFAQLLVNGGPIAVAVLAGPGDQAVAGRFLAALLVARIPLFFFQAVQSSLLPGLARLHALDDRHGFVDLLRRLTGGVAGLGALAVLGCLAAGPAVVRLAFGDQFDLPRRDLALLAAAAGALMVAHVVAHAVVALAGHRRVTLGWGLGVAAAALAIGVGDDLVLRVEIGLVAGAITAAVAHAVALRARLLDWSAAVS